MNLTLRSVYKERDSAKVLYELLRIRSTENDPHTNISHRALPTWPAHLAFYRRHPYRVWYLINVGGMPAGSVFATRRNEIGILLLPDYRGKGIGTWAVRELMKRHQPLAAIPSERSERWLANINPKNEASIRMFARLGFEHLQVTYAL